MVKLDVLTILGKNDEPNCHSATCAQCLACVFSRRQMSHWMCIHALLKISQNIISKPHLTTLSSP